MRRGLGVQKAALQPLGGRDDKWEMEGLFPKQTLLIVHFHPIE